MGRRTLLLIAALVVAALGTVLIFVYVNNLDTKYQDEATLVQVLVATTEVPAGTTASEASANGAFELQELPKSATADGALSNIDIIADQVAQTNIVAGQQIVAQMFAPSGTSSTLAVAKGKLAMSVQLGDPERVAGFVTPGSEVVIFYTEAGSGDTMTIIPRIEVLGTGATTLSTQTTTTEEGEQTTEEIPQAILTLEADQEQAQRIITGQSAGELYFGLLGADTNPRTGRITSPPDLRR
jgi:pilus assembly protein CpaB